VSATAEKLATFLVEGFELLGSLALLRVESSEEAVSPEVALGLIDGVAGAAADQAVVVDIAICIEVACDEVMEL